MTNGRDGTHNAFFYGTLMHPKILTRVINNTGAHLKFCSAVILDHTRHRIKRADYPGVVPFSEGKQLFTHELSYEEKSVRGTLVTGLSQSDIDFLDIFEGPEYVRRGVDAYPLEELKDFDLPHHPLSSTDAASLLPAHPPPLPRQSQLPTPVKAETYIYLYPRKLDPEPWSFEDFVQRNARKWYSSDWDGGELSEEKEMESSGADAKGGSVIQQRMAVGVPSESS